MNVDKVKQTFQLERYQARTVRVNRRKVYEINGYRFPGVTTILSATKSAEDRKALQQWRQRIGKEAAQTISTQASSAGTRLHKQIANFLLGMPTEIPADIEGYWQSILPILNDVEVTLLVEGAVWHPEGYVGFPDAVISYQGQLCVCDWKTALKPKKVEWIGDYLLQVAAYARAVEQVYAQTGIQIEMGLVAIALDQQPAQTFRLDLQALQCSWKGFRQRLDEYYALRPTKF